MPQPSKFPYTREQCEQLPLHNSECHSFDRPNTFEWEGHVSGQCRWCGTFKEPLLQAVKEANGVAK